MEIYLKHEMHGRKIAADFNEAQEDKKYGWEQVTKAEFFKITKANPVEQSERDTLVQAYMDKFGKAPHHRLSLDGIRKALSEEQNDSAA